MTASAVMTLSGEGSVRQTGRDTDVALAASGDRSAFERLYRTHVGRIHSLTRRMLGSHDADEVTQDIFVRTWQKLGQFRGDSAFATWLHRLAVNVVIERRRSYAIQRERMSDDPDALDFVVVVVSLKSVQGEITLEKAKGRVEVRSVNESIHLADINGDLSAETTNGSILLDRIDSGNVDLYTVNGNISYDGPIKDKGAYRLTTHNGLIAMAIPEKVNATLTVRTYNGGFRSTFPLKTGDDQDRRKRFTVTLGSGSAHVELESFGGTIALRRPGEPRPETERRHRDKDKDDKSKDDNVKEKSGDVA